MDDEIPRGLLEAAGRHDIVAIQALSDWFRDRGRPSDPHWGTYSAEEWALFFDVLAGEIEVQRALARLMRILLPQVTPLEPRRFRDYELDIFLSQRGLPMLSVVSPYTDRPDDVTIIVPTDGEREEETRGLVTSLLHAMYPRKRFIVRFENRWMSEAGYNAYQALPDPLAFDREDAATR